MQLYQKYRPRFWSDYVGQDKASTVVRRIIERDGFDRAAFWIECAGGNNSGTGKTTLAWLIAGQLADDFFVQEVDGARVTKTYVESMMREARLCTWGGEKRFRVWIVNEAHAITSGAVDLCLTWLENLPAHTVVIFTTTRRVDANLFGDHDSGPFASRCFKVTLTNQGLAKPFAERARWIAQQEKLDGKPLEAYVKLVQECKNNFRAVLQRIEAGTMLEG